MGKRRLVRSGWITTEELGLAVPLDQPGTNPSQLAQSPQLQFKERYLDDYNH